MESKQEIVIKPLLYYTGYCGENGFSIYEFKMLSNNNMGHTVKVREGNTSMCTWLEGNSIYPDFSSNESVAPIVYDSFESVLNDYDVIADRAPEDGSPKMVKTPFIRVASAYTKIIDDMNSEKPYTTINADIMDMYNPKHNVRRFISKMKAKLKK